MLFIEILLIDKIWSIFFKIQLAIGRNQKYGIQATMNVCHPIIETWGDFSLSQYIKPY